MDHAVDERDFRLLAGDRYTFSVLSRVLHYPCRVVRSDHERLIFCHTVLPYPVWIWTPMMAKRPGDYMKQAAAGIPMGRVAYAEDYLGMIFFLSSAASSYVTGQTFLVDGGWSVSRVFQYSNE